MHSALAALKSPVLDVSVCPCLEIFSGSWCRQDTQNDFQS